MGFPVETQLEAIHAALSAGEDIVLTAPPGSGKTTCVPPSLLADSWLQGKKIVMLEPRRLAARNCANYIAKKLGENVGGVVGYQVRLERKISSSTRLEILTEGLLTNRIMNEPELSDVGLIIFDEFHERSLQGDLAFAMALDVKRALRPDLRLMVMSATLDVDEVSRGIGRTLGIQPRAIHAEGRMFPVETRYLGEVSMTAAIERALKETEGDILCFLPGEGEISRTAASVNSLDCEVLQLYGSLSKEEQDRVFRPASRRKVILATSIAETSLTIEGITTVIDSGLMRVPRFSPATGMSGLVTLPLTLDRAEQRRGRAGRVKAGVCYRLWRQETELSRPKRMLPEILEADLCSLVLTSTAWGAKQREDLPWLTLPADSAWNQAMGLLTMLGAIDDRGSLTNRGQEMARLPMHPRLANMWLSAGGSEKVAMLAAIIEEGARGRETDVRYVERTGRIRQLAKRFRGDNQTESTDAVSEGVALAFAYPDRIAKNRGNGTFTMVSGRGAFLPEEDPLAHEPYLVCCELDDRQGDAKIFLAAPIREEEIVELFESRLVEETFCEWDRKNERVKAVVRLRLGAMTLGEKPLKAESVGEQVMEAMLDGIRQKGVENLPCWTKETLQLKARINFLWKLVTDEALLLALSGFISGMNKWKDLESLNLAAVMDFMLSENGHDRRELDRLAPAKMMVPTGSNVTIHYEGDEPMVAVRLQECFGLMETPKIADGKVPIVMTLLSPAQRPIQITKDLAGFWRGAYQIVRKDMRGRYPKHYWPEDPLTATATRRVRPTKG